MPRGIVFSVPLKYRKRHPFDPFGFDLAAKAIPIGSLEGVSGIRRNSEMVEAASTTLAG